MRSSLFAAALFAALNFAVNVLAIDLYTENFEVNPTANWTLNGAANVDDPQSHAANYFFDYSTVGIPKAPNSAPGDTTRGMKLQTNLDFDSDGITGVPTGSVTGMSVSPNGQDFSTAGDYKLTFDLWGNFPGPFPAGSSGTTNLSTFGIGTSGTFPNYPGSADGIWFAGSLDGGTTSDYRAYSIERNVSYQVPGTTPEDEHATHHAGSRNNMAQLYVDNFGNVMAPPAQLALFSQQTGSTMTGVLGMEWHAVEISKIGNAVDWKVDGVSLITLDTTNFATPPAGSNILFGHSDINAGASTDPLRFDLLFTLIDNIKVSTIEAGPVLNADFNGNQVVDAADYAVWRNNAGLMGTGTKATGDANGDTNVDQADYGLWRASFGTSSAGIGAGTAVPEPSCALLCLAASIGICAAGRRR